MNQANDHAVLQVGSKRLRGDVDGGRQIDEDRRDPQKLIDDYRRGLMETNQFLIEILKLCEEPQSSEEDKTK